MSALHTQIRIHAQPRTVWEVLADFGHYGEWNPLIRQITGTLTSGARLRLLIKLAHLPRFSLRVTVRAVDTGVTFQWTGSLLSPALFCGYHQFKVVPDGEGETYFEQTERYSGYFSFLSLIARPILSIGFQQMNEALKAHVEAKCPNRCSRSLRAGEIAQIALTDQKNN